MIADFNISVAFGDFGQFQRSIGRERNVKNLWARPDCACVNLTSFLGWMRVEELPHVRRERRAFKIQNREVVAFNTALQLPATRRAAYLDEVCAGDVERRFS